MPSLKEDLLDLAVALGGLEVAEIDNLVDLCPQVSCARPFSRRHAFAYEYRNSFAVNLRREKVDGSVCRSPVKIPLQVALYGRSFALRAAVLHRGGTVSSGHYLCHVPVESGKVWIVFNDGSVTENRQVSSLLSTHAYLR